MDCKSLFYWTGYTVTINRMNVNSFYISSLTHSLNSVAVMTVQCSVDAADISNLYKHYTWSLCHRWNVWYSKMSEINIEICFFSKLLVWISSHRLLSQLQICMPRLRQWSGKWWNNRDKFSYTENKNVGNCLYAFNLDFSPWPLSSIFNLCM